MHGGTPRHPGSVERVCHRLLGQLAVGELVDHLPEIRGGRAARTGKRGPASRAISCTRQAGDSGAAPRKVEKVEFVDVKKLSQANLSRFADQPGQTHTPDLRIFRQNRPFSHDLFSAAVCGQRSKCLFSLDPPPAV